jgi:phage tail sheath protein FI
MNYTTPGVFVEEISTFPPSVVPVATAVPAFIGYTATATGPGGVSLLRVPTRIQSLLEFEALFGQPFAPVSYRVQLDVAGGNTLGTVTPLNATAAERRYYLYHALRQYFANGGGPCFIVSVGLFPSQVVLGNANTGLQGGLTPVRSLDGPTLILSPDAVNLSDAEQGAFHVAALTQARDLQDRFVIMDLRTGNAAPAVGVDPAANYRQNVGTLSLRYGAAYYPWLRTIYRPDVHFRDMSFVTPANVAIPNATIDGLLGVAENQLVTDLRGADADVNVVTQAVNVTAWVSSPVTLTRANFTALENHFDTLTGVFRTLPNDTLATVRPAVSNLVIYARAVAIALQTISAANAGLAPEINQAMTSLQTDAALLAAITALIALEKNAAIMNIVAAGRVAANVDGDYAALNGTVWLGGPASTVGAVAANAAFVAGGSNIATAEAAASAIRPHFSRIAAAVLAVFEAAGFLSAGAEARVFDGHPVLRAARERVIREMSLLPPSGAVAGVYSAVDRTRGVWVAPANVSLAEVIEPAVRVNDAGQGRFNVHTSGKSVNVIRAFTGQGTLVWGARTLAGNDNEWRYINVRRFFNMAETSIKKATEPFVFEPNAAGTWVRVKSMIEAFLTIQWRQGALMGATTGRAFFVRVGLGQTMTAQDILEGRMIVEIGMAVVRPAEFIILKFAHKMQEN